MKTQINFRLGGHQRRDRGAGRPRVLHAVAQGQRAEEQAAAARGAAAEDAAEAAAAAAAPDNHYLLVLVLFLFHVHQRQQQQHRDLGRAEGEGAAAGGHGGGVARVPAGRVQHAAVAGEGRVQSSAGKILTNTFFQKHIFCEEKNLVFSVYACKSVVCKLSAFQLVFTFAEIPQGRLFF